MNQAKVITVGSINIDLVAYAHRHPHAGETLPGERFTIGAGGKGANQAIQAALSGARSCLVARVGDDVFADYAFKVFDQAGVDHAFVFPDAAGTGIGHVLVAGEGDYGAVIIARANGNLSPDDVDRALPALKDASLLLLQLEIPMATTLYAAKLARSLGLTVFLNAAPYAPMPDELLTAVDVLVVNEIEAEMLGGLTVGKEMMQWRAAVQHLQRQVPNVVLSLGARGVMAADASGQIEYLAGHPVPVVNTIGAGDAFIGELAARMAEGMPLLSAVPFANAAAALSVTQAASQGIQRDRAWIQELVAKSSPVICQEGKEVP